MPLFAIGYSFEAKPGRVTTGVSYRGGPTMTEDEARGIVVGQIMEKFPGSKLWAISMITIPAEDIQKAANWPAPTGGRGPEVQADANPSPADDPR